MKINDYKKYEFLDSLEGLPNPASKGRKTFITELRLLFPGVALCFFMACAAMFLSENYNSPVMLIALLMGMSCHFLSAEKSIMKGLHFTTTFLLRAGIVLLGTRIAVQDILYLGQEVFLFILGASFCVVGLAVFLSKLMGIDKQLAFISGGACAICGASAALALAAVMPQTRALEKLTLTTIIGVTLFGTLAMIVYPVFVTLLDFDDLRSGVFIGGTIHDVSQVVGASFTLSEDVGETAVLVKLMRVFCLIPMLFIFMYLWRGQKKGDQSLISALPFFLIFFVVAVSLNSIGIFSASIQNFSGDLSKLLFYMAIIGIGVKTSVKSLFELGLMPFVLIFTESVFLVAMYLAFIFVVL